MKKILYLFALLVAPAINAQGILTGTVLDKETKAPLAEVDVFNNMNFQSTVTDEKGRFSLEVPRSGVVILEHPDFDREEVTFELDKSGEADLGNIHLIRKDFKQEYDPLITYDDYKDYKKEFIWGDGKNGILVRQYRSRNEASFVIVEGITNGEPNGVVFSTHTSSGYKDLRFFIAENFSKDYREAILGYGDSWIISLVAEEEEKKVKATISFTRKGMFTPEKDNLSASFQGTDGKLYHISTCDNSEYVCSPEASFAWSEDRRFHGIWLDEYDDSSPLLGYSTTRSSDVELFGKYVSYPYEELNIAKHNNSPEFGNSILFGKMDQDGDPASRENYVKGQGNRMYYVYYNEDTSEYEEVDISRFLHEMSPLGK